MARTSDVSEALATLQARWGAAAPRRGLAAMPRGEDPGPATEGALALAPMVAPDTRPDLRPEPGTPLAPSPLAPTPLAPVVPRRPGLPAPDADGRVVPTGFAALDAILGPGGLPRDATVALRGALSSGSTTVALRVAAEAQAGGAIVAWLDLARAFDPVEAVARGVRPEWLVVLSPADLEEALALAGALLAARTVDLLVMDLPEGRDPAIAGRRVGDRLGRLAALARRAGTLVVILEPAGLGRTLATAVEAASGLRLELRRSGWIRLGRDVVGQRSAVEVARNRYGPPGRRATLEILYAEGGPRDACLARPDLLAGLATRAAPPSLVAPAAPPGLPRCPTGHATSRGGIPATGRVTATHAPYRPERPPAIGRSPCACCTCSGPTCPCAWHGRGRRSRHPTAPPARGRPARSSSADSPGRTGPWWTRIPSRVRSACDGGSRSGAPTGSHPRRPSSTSRLTRTGTPSRPPASGSRCSAPASPRRATSPTRPSGGSRSTWTAWSACGGSRRRSSPG